MYKGLLHAHSGLRWVALVLILVALIQALSNLSNSAPNRTKNKMALFAFIFSHIQLLLGLALFFISPKVKFGSGMMTNKVLRFFTIEHSLVMIIAILLITVGYSSAKKSLTVGAANKKIALYFGIALILILIRIPWPFLGVGGSWF